MPAFLFCFVFFFISLHQSFGRQEPCFIFKSTHVLGLWYPCESELHTSISDAENRPTPTGSHSPSNHRRRHNIFSGWVEGSTLTICCSQACEHVKGQAGSPRASPPSHQRGGWGVNCRSWDMWGFKTNRGLIQSQKQRWNHSCEL